MKLTTTQGAVFASGIGLVLLAIVIAYLASFAMVPGMPAWLALIPGVLGILLAALALLLPGGSK